MIIELLDTPFLTRRDAAEDAWDRRLQDAELTCPECFDGWKEDEWTGGWYRCGKCQGGSIYTQLCIRCNNTEGKCPCKVGDFMEGK